MYVTAMIRPPSSYLSRSDLARALPLHTLTIVVANKKRYCHICTSAHSGATVLVPAALAGAPTASKCDRTCKFIFGFLAPPWPRIDSGNEDFGRSLFFRVAKIMPATIQLQSPRAFLLRKYAAFSKNSAGLFLRLWIQIECQEQKCHFVEITNYRHLNFFKF